MSLWAMFMHTHKHTNRHFVFSSSVTSGLVFRLLASIAPPVEWGWLGLEAETWTPWCAEFQCLPVAGALQAAGGSEAGGRQRCLLKFTSAQGCSLLPLEVRISPRQEGVVPGQDIGRKA